MSEHPAVGENLTPPVLSMLERRILGVLVEKAKTTPDAYPLSINSLVTGSNQKSNRDPLLDLTDLDIEETLSAVQKKGLAIKITGGRVIRWRHNLYEAWRVDKVELAVLGELLLRGPQTEGELRGRASRMEPIDDLDALRAVLKRLTDRKLVVYLSPEARRGAVLTHGFHEPRELDRLRVTHKEAPFPPGPTGAVIERPLAQSTPMIDTTVVSQLATRLEHAEAEIAAMKRTISDLTAQLRRLATDLGVEIALPTAES